MDRNFHYSLNLPSSPVALRKESVDRNTKINTRGSEKMKSLSARRAWIEITTDEVLTDEEQVALRKESVDRNCYLDNIEITQAKSLSARRAWIEMPTLC